MPFYVHCGKEVSEQAKACPNCGQPGLTETQKQTSGWDVLQRISALITALIIPAIIGLYSLLKDQKTQAVAHKQELENKIKMERQEVDSKIDKELEQGGEILRNANLLLDNLATENAVKKKRGLLFAIAYYQQAKLPPAILPMLALTDAINDKETSQIFLDALQRLATSPEQTEDTRRYASIAIKKLTARRRT